MTSEERIGGQYRDLETFSGSTVYDDRGEKIGKVDDLFVDENNRPEYIGVQMGLFGLSGSTLIPMEIVRVNDRRRAIEVNESKNRVKEAPHFDRDDDITSDFEARVFSHYGLTSSAGKRGSYGDYYESTSEEGGRFRERGEDTALRDREEREEPRDYPAEGSLHGEEEPGEHSDAATRDREERVESRDHPPEEPPRREEESHERPDAVARDREREESPEYREGYEAAMREMGAEPEESTEYREGYDAAMKEVERERERSHEYPDATSEDRERREYPAEEREARPAPSDERSNEGRSMRIRKRSRTR